MKLSRHNHYHSRLARRDSGEQQANGITFCFRGRMFELPGEARKTPYGPVYDISVTCAWINGRQRVSMTRDKDGKTERFFVPQGFNTRDFANTMPTPKPLARFATVPEEKEPPSVPMPRSFPGKCIVEPGASLIAAETEIAEQMKRAASAKAKAHKKKSSKSPLASSLFREASRATPDIVPEAFSLDPGRKLKPATRSQPITLSPDDVNSAAYLIAHGAKQVFVEPGRTAEITSRSHRTANVRGGRRLGRSQE